jgi:hypothetical protein
MSRYLEAIVHPFGNSCIGAIIPDRYQELVIPTTDRLELDISPSDFILGTPPGSGSGFTLVGCFMWFQPRCIGSGILGRTTMVDQSTIFPIVQYPYMAVDTDFNVIENSVILQQYALCIVGIWSSPGGKQYGFYIDDGQSPGEVNNYFAVIGYSRFSNIDANCDKLRIVGAGLKAWSEEAPINTGGYSVGGWATISDIIENFRWQGAQDSGDPYGEPVNPAAIGAFQTKIKFACRSPAVKGSTVRYSSLQTADQHEAEYPKIPERMYEMSNETGGQINSPGITIPNVNSNDDLAIQDVITPGCYVPCIFWSFNTNATSGITEQYTIKVMSMVHSEGTPTGSSPFMSTKSMADPAMDYVKTMVENVEVFPVATSGHSFKSFFTKTRHILAKVAHVTGHFTRLIAFADKFAETFV